MHFNRFYHSAPGHRQLNRKRELDRFAGSSVPLIHKMQTPRGFADAEDVYEEEDESQLELECFGWFQDNIVGIQYYDVSF